MTVDMGTVWDRTTEFLSDNLGAIVPVFAGALWLPRTLSTLLGKAASAGGSPSPMVGLFVLLLVLPTVWGNLAIAAHALDPDSGAVPARQAATRSFGYAVLIMIVIAIVQFALLLPVPIALAVGGLDVQALAAGDGRAAMASVSGGVKTFVALYAVVWLVVALVISVRTALAMPALIAERAGMGAIARAFALSRGIAWKMIGVYLLFFMVLGVASTAVTYVSGAIFGLLLPDTGAWGIGSIITAVLSGLVSAIGALVIAAFGAKLYRAVTAGAAKPA